MSPADTSSRWAWLDQLMQDARYGTRVLIKAPAFALTTIFTLAAGLALTTGVFTAFNAYVLRPFPVRDPGTLHQLVWHARGVPVVGPRWRDYLVIRDRTDLFAEALAQATRYVSLNGRPLAAELVSGSYFSMLAPEMAIGRPLTAGDDAGDAVVISHQVWSGVFGRDASVVGRGLELSGRRFVIVGVAGPRFTGLHAMPRDVWIPLAAYAALVAPDLLSDGRAVEVTVRLRPGVTPLQAQRAMTPLVVDAVGPDHEAWAEVRLHDRPTPLTLRLVTLLSPIFAAFALVLLAACANVSSVMLARAVVRQREIAVRLSLGASRSRIVRQLVTEGILIAVPAALTSLALTAAGVRIGIALFFETLPSSLAAILRMAPLVIDIRVFLFAVAAGLASTVAFSLLPALQASRPVLTSALGAHVGGGRRSSRLRAALVAAQVAIALLLVVPALTLARNGLTIRDADVGFVVDDVMSIHVREGRAQDQIRRLSEVLPSEPGVARFAVANGNPLFGPPRGVVIEAGQTRAATPFTLVSPEYFGTLRIPIVRGRVFREDEASLEAHVAIVGEATALTLWPGEDPVGKTLRIAAPAADPDHPLAGYSEVTVIGTAGDIISGLVVDGPEAGHLYLPMAAGSRHATSLLARARLPSDLTREAMHRILRRAVPDPEVFEAVPLQEVRTLQVYPFTAAAWIGAALGLVALVLSVSGLFGVLTYTLSQRSKEIGIRMALGATAAMVVRLVMKQTALVAGAGAVAGTAGAFALLQLLGATVRLRAVNLLDVSAFVAGLLLVAAAAAIAAYRPARRAARVNPAETLRADS